MNKIYLASYKAQGDIVDKIIRFFTRGKYSHSELVIHKFEITDHYHKDEWFECYSSSPRDGGVRVKRISALSADKWDLIELKETSESDIKAYFEQTKGTKYDYAGAIGIKLGIKESRSKVFCSEWIFNFLFNSSGGWRIEPNLLHEILKGKK
ncbi:Uncharacterised protein [Actinobacillus lignieresii]|uniref:enoyl-CoA hydratase n=1 Tax=Actinobacillus lignieresii TaxID=720 RepID=UPI000F71FB85|nr:enoyl-CoA hydratase [Actinobacillus lignieresii]VEB25781.1 Uncharacterised protein [Actinobacillus lignieresii]